MKKVIVMMAVLAIAVPAMAFHGVPEWQTNSYDCDACHIPHTNSNVGTANPDGIPYSGDEESLYGAGNALGVPLWSAASVTGEDRYSEFPQDVDGNPIFTMYSSDTFDGAGNQAPGPIGSTILCMSCHDRVHKGTLSSGYTINETMGDLSTSHPVDFVYDTALATTDGELVDPTTGESFATRGPSRVPTGGTIDDDLLFASNLGGKVVNCVSCHEIHMNGLQGEHVTDGEWDADGNVVTAPTYDHGVLDIPRLQPLATPVAIGYYTGWGGDETVLEDWSLNYGGLCKTCHIK